MRRRDALPDPEVDRGLRELEAALAGEPAADPDLLVLVADVDAARPQPDAAFLASLDARVHAGFPREAETPRRVARAPWHERLRAPHVLGPFAVAALSAIVVTLAITSSHGGGSGSGSSGSTSSASSSSATTDSAQVETKSATTLASPQHPESVAKSSGSASASSSTSAGSTQFLGAAGSALRKVERAASLTLTPAPSDVQDTADGVVRATQAAGGYVQQSNVTTRDRSGSAQFTLRIPSNRLDSTLAQLSKLAHVGALNQSSTDITAQTDSAADRLQEAAAERKALLRALGAATTTERISSLKARLADNRKVIAARRTELTTQQRRAQLATVAVDVEGKRGAAAEDDKPSRGGPWSPGDALHDAGRVLSVALGVALIALAVLLPLALVALLAALAARALRRHRRETALDASAP
jgi:hypothetical protein